MYVVMRKTSFGSKHLGFTLAELLSALAILGVIATFTIPKVLNATQSGQYNAIAKEAGAFVSQAYSAYGMNNTIDENTTFLDLTPYLNYVREDTSTLIDRSYNDGVPRDCSETNQTCVLLHNGAMFNYQPNIRFGGTNATNAIVFRIDPDATYDSNPTGPAKALTFVLYINGRLTSRNYALPSTTYYTGGGPTTIGPTSSSDPPWFEW